jgi:hypothetical protein
MNHWKWSKGEPYYKSARLERGEQEPEQNNKNIDYDSQKNAIHQSLAEDTFFNQDSMMDINMDNDMIGITNSMFSRNQNLSGTRREDLDLKISDREMISQRGVNPFLQTSYVNDIVTRDMFLKPVNTTQGRTKNTDQTENAN